MIDNRHSKRARRTDQKLDQPEGHPVSLAEALSMPTSDDIDFEPPRLGALTKPFDF